MSATHLSNSDADVLLPRGMEHGHRGISCDVQRGTFRRGEAETLKHCRGEDEELHAGQGLPEAHSLACGEGGTRQVVSRR